MVSLEHETLEAASKAIDSTSSSPRISFSADFLDENSFICICPNPQMENNNLGSKTVEHNADFEFSSGNNKANMISPADELFCEGKILPLGQKEKAEKLTTTKMALNSENNHHNNNSEVDRINKDDSTRRISRFLDDDPSPRPPKCTVLWKELLRLKKQRGNSTLSPSLSLDDKEKANAKRVCKKGLERTTAVSISPVVNVPICAQPKKSALPPLFSLKKGRLDR